CTLTPFDGATSGTAVQTASGSAVSIVNSPPSSPTATLTPTTADANTTLTCSVATPGEDPDHDTVTHTVAWTVDDSATTATGATLMPSAAGAGKGDKVCCIVTAGDGSDSSPPSAPACVTLDNAGPTLESVFLQTQAGTLPATRADTLVCAPQQASDPDGDALTWTYSWQVGGQPLANQTSATLSAAGLALGAAVSCTAKACDGDGACTDVIASKNTVVIANALPTLGGVTIPDVDGKAQEEDTLTCAYTGWSDIDGDPEQVTYTWLLIAADGTVTTVPNATGPTFTITGAIAPGTKLQCTATPMNGSTAGNTVTSANQILVNAPTPIAAVVAVTAPNGASGDATCTITTPAKWLPANAVATYYWSINGAAEAARPATLTAAQVSDCDLLKCRLVYTAPGLDLPSNTASTQLPLGKDCEDGNPCTTHSCFAAGGCNAVPQDGSSCDDGDPCTENEICDNGACVGTQDVCVEDRLTVAASASRPYLAANGSSGYVTTWYDNTRSSSVLRETDADESRVESELQILPAGISRPLGAFQHAVSPSGFIGVARADNMPTIFCNCAGNYTFGVNFKRYAPDMKTFDEVAIGTFGSGVQCFGSCLNRIYENRAESIAYSDDAFGTLHAYQFYVGNGLNKAALEYRLVGSNLATTPAVTLVPAANMYSMERWDAELVPDGSDQFVVAWLGVDGKSVLAQRFSREGVAQYANPITVGTSTGILNRVAVAAMSNGRFVVAWEGLGVDAGGTGIAVQRVDEAGSLLGSAVIVAPTEAGDQTLGNVAAFDTFAFVVAFRDAAAPTATYRARLFSASAVAGTTITLNEATTTAVGSAPTVQALSDGDWVAAWVDGSEVLWTRRYHQNGTASPRAAEFRANDEPTNAQESPSAAATTSGNVLVAYASKVFPGAPLGTEIVTRLFDASGLEVALETIVNEVTAASQTTPVVAAGADRFVVVWNSEDQDGSVDGLYAKLFDEDGTALSPTSLGVTVKTDSYQRQPAVAMATSGTWVAAWNGYTDATAQSDVYLRIFPSTGNPTGEIVANTTTTNVQEKPAVAVVPFANEFIVAWQSRSAATGYDIMVRKFGLDGTALTTEMLVNTTTTGDQRSPALAISQSGSLVICWESVGQVTAGKAVVACQRLRTLNLLPQGSEYLPLSSTNDQLNPQLRYQSNGRLAIAYQALAVDSAGYGLQLVRVNDLGTRVAPTITANRYWTSDQTRPWLIPMDDRVFVGWQSEGQDGSAAGIYFRILPQH
ncbi:MAG: hypothetical protein JNJ59_21910, partial [Deltaproteobacteria bacterium]|nr:hypothetical protein [Deltaproteobacteria bacterium]